MKKLFLLIALIFISKSLFAQTKQVLDSLNNVLATSTQDTAKVMALCLLSFYEQDPVRSFSLVNNALALTRKIQFEKGEAQCYHALGIYFRRTSDYPQSLEFHLKALKIREKLKYTQGIAESLGQIGQLYFQQQNYETALAYYFKAVEVLKQINKPDWSGLYGAIGNVYLKQNKLDSALVYSMKNYKNANNYGAKYSSGNMFRNLGDLHTALGNTELAFSYYRMGVASTIENNYTYVLSENYLGLAKLFMKTSNKDSAIYYAKKTLTISDLSKNKTGVMNAARLLSQLYENSDDEEAFRYNKMALEATDSIFSGARIAQIQSLSFSEQERQREINESKLKEAEDRKHNLQFAAIAIGLITFIILFFALSRSIIVKTKFIEFFGVLLLLAVFEFINLLIHPYLAHITHDSPVLMLGVLIAIGALLIPFHHKLEKWITKIMVEKNKKIRLDAAKKTIATLEPN